MSFLWNICSSDSSLELLDLGLDKGGYDMRTAGKSSVRDR